MSPSTKSHTNLVNELKTYQIELEHQNQELRDSRQALEDSRDRFLDLYDFAPHGYITYDQAGTILEINFSAANLFGKERNTFIGLPFSAFVAKDNRDKFWKHLQQCVSAETGTKIQSTLSLLGPDGVDIPTQIQSVGFLQPGTDTVVFRTTMVDMTEIKKLEREREEFAEREMTARAEAERANEAKDEFLAVVSHELRAPLQPILGWLELILDGSVPPEEQRNALMIIQRNAKAQAQIVSDLLDVSRVISGKLLVELSQIYLNTVIESTIESIRPQATEKGLILHWTTDGKPSPMLGDAARIRQIILNLLSNAIKFTPKGGKITVQVQNLDGHVELCVCDTGVGIAPEFLPHIFERFRQEDASKTRDLGGLGLGLAIVDHLVSQHGGKIVVTSGGLNLGVKFKISFPLISEAEMAKSQADPAKVPKMPRGLKRPILHGLKVVVVDDDPDTRSTVAAMLGSSDAEVFSASNVDDGMALVEKENPDMVITDIGMPGHDGFSLLRKIRRGHSDFVPVAALTGYTSAEDMSHSLEAGFDVHLNKPIAPATLVRAVAQLTGRL